MQLSRSDLADFMYFLAIARHRNLRLAGADLGVSASALSHALKNLETRLGVRLLNRTTRSITLTAAGEELLTAVSGPVDAIGQAIDALNRFRASPAGRVRLNVPLDAATHLLAPVLPAFAERYPDVEIEITVSNRLVDVVEGGFDAGIRFGGTMPEDMVSQRLSDEIRWVVVGTPDYFERCGIPRHPNDLMLHQCVRIRLGSGEMYRWDFERGDDVLQLAVPGPRSADHRRDQFRNRRRRTRGRPGLPPGARGRVPCRRRDLQDRARRVASDGAGLPSLLPRAGGRCPSDSSCSWT